VGREGVEITGMVRKVDGLGRVVLPIELRRTMGIDEKDPLENFVNIEQIILKNFEPACVFAVTHRKREWWY